MRAADRIQHAWVTALPLLAVAAPYCAAGEGQVTFEQQQGRLQIRVDADPLATYVYEDREIPRPYFCNVCTPGGIHVTRNHPPVQGKDPLDHATYHPGLWMAFGDLNGSDYWRNRARVVHERFVEEPAGGRGKGSFAVRNRYGVQDRQNRVNCWETARYCIHVGRQGYLLIWESTFSASREFYFGDQEEMGLGLRVASPITVKAGGTIRNSEGDVNEDGAWGKAAEWCDYSGTIDAHRVGITLMADPGNFRPSWYHARDYGLLVANPFGRKAFGQGEASRLVIKPGRPFRLRYGILLHAAADGGQFDPRAAYDDFVRVISEESTLAE